MKTRIFLSLFTIFAPVLFLSAQQLGSGHSTYVTNFNTNLLSGMYRTDKAQVNYPYEIPAWPVKHLINSADGNNLFQISSPYTHDDRIFFRKTVIDSNNPNANNQWYEVATRGTNIFTGSQVIKNNSLQIGSDDYHNQLKFDHDTNSKHSYITFPSIIFFINDKLSEQPMIQIDSNGITLGGYNHSDKLLKVAGTIKAKELRAQTNVWADFVFEKDYKLPTLSEIKVHIEKHNHLSGIPTESEVKENGINVAEISAKLLQKIEELTLYTIHQQEQIEELYKKIEVLEKSK